MRKPEVTTQWIRDALAEHGSSLTRYAYSMVGDLEQARDVVQETFLALCRQDPERVRDYLTEWLFRVCRNRAMDARRRTSAMQNLRERQPVEGSEYPLPHTLLEQKEMVEEVMKALDELPAQQQEVMRLKFHHELTYKEISSVTGLSVSNVGFLIHTAVTNIRHRLSPELGAAATEIRRVK